MRELTPNELKLVVGGDKITDITGQVAKDSASGAGLGSIIKMLVRTKTTHCIGSCLILRTENPILDEATSHLDIANEKAVNANLNDLSIIKIMAAHRKGNGGIS